MIQVIGITGYARSGKDTLANILVSDHDFVKLSLAEPLKQVCKIIFSFTIEQLYGNLKDTVDPRWGFSPRYAMQHLGTELVKNFFGEDIWVKNLKDRINTFIELGYTKFVISDVRFADEIRILQKSFDIEIWKIVRFKKDEENLHISEQVEKLYFDKVINNINDYKHLKSEAKSLVSKL